MNTLQLTFGSQNRSETSEKSCQRKNKVVHTDIFDKKKAENHKELISKLLDMQAKQLG